MWAVGENYITIIQQFAQNPWHYHVARLWTTKLPDEFTFVEHNSNSGQVKLPWKQAPSLYFRGDACFCLGRFSIELVSFLAAHRFVLVLSWSKNRQNAASYSAILCHSLLQKKSWNVIEQGWFLNCIARIRNHLRRNLWNCIWPSVIHGKKL